jgi:hypothetical protein
MRGTSAHHCCYVSPEFLGKVLVGKALTAPRFKRNCEISKGFQLQSISESASTRESIQFAAVIQLQGVQMAEREEGKVGILPKELVGVDCPRCGFRISEDSEISFNREDSFFVGYSLICPKCGNAFSFTLY